MTVNSFYLWFPLSDAPLFPGAVPEPPTDVVPDTGRKDGLPKCPIIFVAGLSQLFILSLNIESLVLTTSLAMNHLTHG